jgi:hypothetical protein
MLDFFFKEYQREHIEICGESDKQAKKPLQITAQYFLLKANVSQLASWKKENEKI